MRQRPRARTRSISADQSVSDIATAIAASAAGDRSEGRQSVRDGSDHVGLIRVDAMDGISQQLKRNAQFRQHGPGLPTSVAVHRKFIAIGTSHGLVLVFDHFQEPRSVLKHEPGGSVPASGPVTSIDASDDQEFLVCAYASGKIILWDMVSSAVLKVVHDAHNLPIASVRIWQRGIPMGVAAMDVGGKITLLTFTKRLFVWSVDKKLLVDGKGGPVFELAALASVSKSSMPLLAFSSRKDTFIVRLHPDPPRVCDNGLERKSRDYGHASTV